MRRTIVIALLAAVTVIAAASCFTAAFHDPERAVGFVYDGGAALGSTVEGDAGHGGRGLGLLLPLTSRGPASRAYDDGSNLARASARPGGYRLAPRTARQTTILGENVAERVMPFADATGSRTLGFGATADEWAAMTPRQRFRLNDGMLRARIRDGDDFRYIGQDPLRPPDVRSRFDLTRSELLRLDERGIPYDIVSPDEVFKTIGRY